MTAKSPHARVFEQLIAERRRALLDALVNQPHDRTAGIINGLDEALKLSEEADFKLSGEE